MGIRIEDAEGRGARLEAAPGPPGGRPRVGLLIEDPSGRTSWSCSPAAARELAAALVGAAREAEDAPPEPVTVKARELLRGDVRDGRRVMTVESVRTDGANVQVTWTSDGGRSWSQVYAAETDILLRRRLRPEDGRDGQG
ncbi:hypothetical protein OG909_02205 [Streptomyces sp. NBC_01754]|uniref:hypothetical protein n=1 Tax=Streptomyces sp. NBC_01754 TaxID=2975930 RepID=UPI002DDA36A3|nr:hypothetical protein [Streptomyces sp. NBC_01754]WSC91206.1 hypothetical protein OG909_02205 [Streptomyces sp. NBC_01754]